MTGNSRFAVSVHILAYLAYRQCTAVPSAEIAASVDTNPVVIRRLLSALVKAGLVTAQKGATGGFALATTPDKITLRDIYRAAEPSPSHGLAHFAPNTKCPVSAAEMASEIVSRSRISPTRITSGSSRRAALSAFANDFE